MLGLRGSRVGTINISREKSKAEDRTKTVVTTNDVPQSVGIF
jgi:hypothetical protein